MICIFEVFVEGYICEPIIMLTLMASAIKIRKIIFVWVLTSSLDLINSLWLKVRVNERIIMLVLDTWWHNQNGGIFWFLGYQFLSFLEKNIGDLKFNFFEGRMTNKTIIALKINSWKKHQKMNCIFKSLVFCIFDKQLVI